MKKCLLIWIFAMCVTMVACSKEENGYCDNSNEKKEYIVSIGVDGEVLDINESPLTKSSGNDLYGIQVFSKTENSEYVPYAYGLFDDKELMNIKLFDGCTYKIEATMVVDGKSKIYDYGVSRYGHPFSCNGPLSITNEFVYDTYNRIYPAGTGSDITPGIYYGRPNIYRYYGSVQSYNPTENSNISIYMKKACFGVKFIADGLAEGKVNINLEEAPKMVIESDNPQIQDVFVMFNFTWDKAGEINESDIVNISANWEKTDGMVVPLINKKITFKRNTLTTITIKVKDTSISNGIDLSQESEEMKEGDNIIFE